MSRPPAAYRLASGALATPVAGYTLVRTLRDGGAGYLRGRYGFGPASPRGATWIHCASVGEVTAAAPLARELSEHDWGPLLVTTSTPTGYRRARQLVPAGTTVDWLPVDRPRPVKRFLDRRAPRAALVLETELWPHLFGALAARAVPIVLVNGRLSRRTMQAPRWWRRTAAWCLARTTRVLARSATDRDRFVALGAPAGRVEVIGNLKLAAPAGEPAPAADLGAPYVLAASTHEDEEWQLARAWAAAGCATHLLAIAPRYPHRGAAIVRRLGRAGITATRRSLGEPPGAAGSVHLADTLGELDALIAGADLVIMGGSLVPRGGQNVLEAARAGRALVTGPHMENFADEAERLEASGALERVPDAAAAVERALRLLANPGRRAAMGEHARGLLAAEADMAARYRRALSAVLAQPRT